MNKTIAVALFFILLLTFSASAVSKIPFSQPSIQSAGTTPEKIRSGDLLEIHATVKGYPLSSVLAEVQHEKGTDTIELKNFKGTYRGVWKSHDLLPKTYSVTITASDILGQKDSVIISYEDPAGLDADTVDSMHWWHPTGSMTRANSIKVYVDEKSAAQSILSGRVLRLTTTTYTGNLGGQSGGDAKCAAEFGSGWNIVWGGTLVDAVIGPMNAKGWNTVSAPDPPTLDNCYGWTMTEPLPDPKYPRGATADIIDFPTTFNDPFVQCINQYGIWCYKDNPSTACPTCTPPGPQSGDIGATGTFVVQYEHQDHYVDPACQNPVDSVNSYYSTVDSYREYDPYGIASFIEAERVSHYKYEGGTCILESYGLTIPYVACASGYTTISSVIFYSPTPPLVHTDRYFFYCKKN